MSDFQLLSTVFQVAMLVIAALSLFAYSRKKD